MSDESTAYTFARLVEEKYHVGSRRRALALFWLARMSRDVMEAWGRGELTDADIMRRAHAEEMVSTSPWLNKSS